MPAFLRTIYSLRTDLSHFQIDLMDGFVSRCLFCGVKFTIISLRQSTSFQASLSNSYLILGKISSFLPFSKLNSFLISTKIASSELFLIFGQLIWQFIITSETFYLSFLSCSDKLTKWAYSSSILTNPFIFSWKHS